MRTFEIITGTVTILIVVGVVMWSFTGRDSQEGKGLEQEVASIETEEDGSTVKTEQASDIQSIAEEFAQLYTKAVRENDEDAAREAREYLTERGKTVVDTGGNVWSGLRRFMFRLEASDRVEIGEVVKKTDSFAEAASTWHYSDRSETYYFYFMLEQNRWRIDSVQSVRQ